MGRVFDSFLAIMAVGVSAAGQPPPYRATSIDAVLADPAGFHQAWVMVKGTVAREGDLITISSDGASLRLIAGTPIPSGEVEVRGQVLDVGRLQRNDRRVALPGPKPSLAELYPNRWPSPGEEIVLSATSVTSREQGGIEVTLPPPPIEVNFSTPIEGEADVRLDTRIRIQFSRDVDPATFKDHIRVSYSVADSIDRGEPQPPGVSITTNYNAAGRVLDIRPSQSLERFRQVTVTLLEGIKGTDGSVLRGWVLNFSTGGS